MKKFWIMAIGISLIFCDAGWAAPAYGTKIPAKKEVFLGIQQYFLKRRDMAGDGHLHSHQNYLTLSYGLQKWLALDLKLSYYSTFNHIPNNGPEVKYNDSVWGGGYGFRIKAYESGPVKAVVGFQHYSIHPKTLKTNGERRQSFLEEWQGSALASYDLKYLIPYAGLRYTSTDVVIWLFNQRSVLKSPTEKRLGPIAGLDVPLTKKVWINLEAEWEDDIVLTSAIHCRF